MPILRETGVFPAPPTTIFPIHIIGMGEVFLTLMKFLKRVPNLNNIERGERKVEMGANNIGVKVINIEFLNEDPFFNINTKEDFEKAKEKFKND